MEIKLPATLTATYEIAYSDKPPYSAPGEVVIRFGRTKITSIKVTQLEHDKLTASGYYGDDDDHDRELEEWVAEWLKARWGL